MGRKRKPGNREKSGKLSRKPEDVAVRRKVAWDAAERDALSTVLDTRMRLFGLSETDARDQKAGSFIGRLYLSAQISRAQYEALTMWGESAYANAAITPGPKGDTALDPNRVAGISWAENEERDNKIRERHKKYVKAVQEKQNELGLSANLFGALYECVQRDRDHYHLLGDLRAAANALAKHFQLQERMAA